ncbi:extracellular solute-binding protein [Paenibacillus sp. TRM 82003]|nr:extracellular solute-binding protein [Paenibacillus sp. TRM 82003]
MKKRLSSLVVLSLLLSLLAACTGSGGEGAVTQTPNDSSNPTTDASSETPSNTPPNDEIVELSLFINHTWYPMSAWTGTIAEEITKRTGVKLNVTVASDTEQLPLMIASGDLPDLVFTVREPRLENPDISYDWHELIEEYAPNFEIAPNRVAVNTSPDGKLYTVLNAYTTPEELESNPYVLGSDGNPGIAVRQDLMDEMGLPPVKTLDDFVAALDKAKSQYPDIVPLTMDIEWIPQYFKMQFGIPPHSAWYESGDGQLRYDITHPRMLDFYKFMNGLYRNGYILAENFTYSNDQIDDEYAKTGKAFAHMHTVSTADRDNAAADYEFTMIPSALTDQAFNLGTGTGFSGVYITKNNKNPEKSIQFIEYLASKEGRELVMFGIEGEHWKWHADGYPVFNYSVNDEEFVNKEGLKWWYLYSDGVVEGMRSYVPGTQTTEALQGIKEITEQNAAIGMVKLRDGMNEKVIFDKLEDMVENEEIKIYLAETEEAAEQAYRNMVDIAADIGLAELEKWSTQEYKVQQAKFQ